MRVRLARLTDVDFVRDLGDRAFSPYGKYGPLLPDWFMRPGVVTFVGERSGRRAGFAMLGFYESPSGWIADLLAIAVSPEHRGAGVGEALLRRAIEEAERVSETLSIEGIELSVAETNEGARRLFTRVGFSTLNAAAGFYDGGQRTIRMVRPLRDIKGDSD